MKPCLVCEDMAAYSASEVRRILKPARVEYQLRTRPVFCAHSGKWHVEFADDQGAFGYECPDFLDQSWAKPLEREVFPDGGRNTWINTQVVLWKTLARWKNNLKFARYVDHNYVEDFSEAVEG